MTDTTTPERWRRIKQIASAALDLEESARAAYLDATCAGDAALSIEVRSLLDSTAAAIPYFETPGVGAAASLIGGGALIGPYRIIRELGRGGMGSVYLADRDDGEFRQRVAIKIVRGGFANALLLQRFRDERDILASLDHPNIARLLDGGTTATGLPYVAMEFVEGEPIDVFCANRSLSLRQRLGVFQQVCAAVQHAHQHLVIHRDIKANNILVTVDGTPKLLDFGIARLLDPQTGLQSGAHTTMRVMTPESASPEQVSGGAVTVAADVYALGVLLYRLLTGRGPYRPPLDTETQVMRAVCEQVPERPSAGVTAVGDRIPEDVDRIVLKALRKEPERRYASAAQFDEDVQRFLDGRPVLAAPDSMRYRARKFAGRHAIAVGAALAVVVAVIGGVAATVWQARVAQRERERAQAQFNAVRGFAQAVLGELHDAVRKLPASTAATEILLRRATEYLDALYAQATDDVTLRREVARGYIRLATVQGVAGLPNTGDPASTTVNLQKAIAMLEPIADAGRGELQDRLSLAQSLARLASVDRNRAQQLGLTDRARQIVEALTPEERSTAYALLVRQTVWAEVAQPRLTARDYDAAYRFLDRVREAAEEALRQRPDSLDASRNLSLAYKRNGAVLETSGRVPEAMALFQKALDLDRRRVAADPVRPIWRLDLSFSYGSLGAGSIETDPRTALKLYEEAVRLREQVVREDPTEDFARVSLARGYARLALIHSKLGNTARAIEYNGRRLRVYRDRLDEHPERNHLWTQCTEAIFDAAGFHTRLAQSAKDPAHRLPHAAQARRLLDDIAAIQARWTREKRVGTLAPATSEVEKLRAQLR